MAYKNIFRLTIRRQGEIIGQIYRLISCYSDFFVSRTRVYIKDVAKSEDTFYWLENSKTSEVTSFAFVDPNYTINDYGIKIYNLGHTITKLNNQMMNIIDHLLGDYKDCNIIFYSRPLFAQALLLEENYSFVGFTIDEFLKYCPEIANKSTDYFNVTTGETVLQGLIRKTYNIYLKVTDLDLELLKKKNTTLYKFLVEKKSSMSKQLLESKDQENAV